MISKILLIVAVLAVCASCAFGSNLQVCGYLQARAQTVDPYHDYFTDGSGKVDHYLFRRLGVQLSGDLTDKIGLCVQWDYSTYHSSFKDVYLSFKPKDDWLVKVGRQTWLFGYYVNASSAGLATMERPMFIRKFFPGDRDYGISAAYKANDITYSLGVFQGIGQNYKDTTHDQNSAKDWVGNIKVHPNKNLTYGASLYYGKGAWARPAYNEDAARVRAGADVEWQIDNRWKFIGETARGKGVDMASSAWDQGEWVTGLSGMMNYLLDKKTNTFVRWSSISHDPCAPQYGRVDNIDIGVVRKLCSDLTLKVSYITTKEHENKINGNNGVCAELLFTY